MSIAKLPELSELSQVDTQGGAQHAKRSLHARCELAASFFYDFAFKKY